MSKLKHCLHEETHRLRFVIRRLGEKRESHAHASVEHDRCLGMYIAARNDVAKNRAHKQNTSRAEFVKIWETLLNSWALNVSSAHRSLSGWEFKGKQQSLIVEKIKGEVKAAEQLYTKSILKIKHSLAHLDSVEELIESFERVHY